MDVHYRGLNFREQLLGNGAIVAKALVRSSSPPPKYILSLCLLDRESKVTRSYVQTGQYHTIVESRIRLTWYESYPKLSRANRLVNPQMSNKGLEKKMRSRASINGRCTLFEVGVG